MSTCSHKCPPCSHKHIELTYQEFRLAQHLVRSQCLKMHACINSRRLFAQCGLCMCMTGSWQNAFVYSVKIIKQLLERSRNWVPRGKQEQFWQYRELDTLKVWTELKCLLNGIKKLYAAFCKKFISWKWDLHSLIFLGLYYDCHWFLTNPSSQNLLCQSGLKVSVRVRQKYSGDVCEEFLKPVIQKHDIQKQV